MGASPLNLLAITCYAGEKPFVDMTDRMLRDLVSSMQWAVLRGHLASWHISVLAQGTRKAPLPTILKEELPITFEEVEKNQGFAYGMNQAYDNGLADFPHDALLCLNNDIEMPHKEWLGELISEYQEDRIICPKTNYTSVNEQRAGAPEDKDPYDHGVTPAVCWLIPGTILDTVIGHLKGKLFPEDLGGRAWGEDNYVNGVVRAKVHPTPCKIVPRSWIHHLGAKTSHLVPAEEKMRAHHEAHRRLKQEFS